MSFSEEEKALHLAKLREFHDRTQAIDFVMLDLDAKFSDRELLRTVALTRLMLDNIETISLADYDLSQEKKLDADLFRQCVEVGLNLSWWATSRQTITKSNDLIPALMPAVIPKLDVNG